ncbi:ABC transporter permease [Martelella soudanensis]|uniref:ABC transporter permease n=1 Tax=unclassified Martelella TaxID=2629616 RepID=UPI0015DD9CE8|nr:MULTISPECIES: ABC transporter permease [unclassified Martelella]
MSATTAETQDNTARVSRFLAGLAESAARLLPPVFLFLAVGVFWQTMVYVLEIPRYLLPAPTVIFARIIEDWRMLFDNGIVTAAAAASGFVIGTAVAVFTAVCFLYSRVLQQALFPWAIVIKTIPIIAIAPLLTIWLGFGIQPKIAVAAISCFFPTLVNVTRGLKSLDAPVLDFMKIIHASQAQVFWHARRNAALPYLFSAMKITVGMSMIGAIVAEFTGANLGIGTIIVNAGYRQDAVMLFSAIIVTSLVTIAMYYAVILLEKFALRWPGANVES